MLLYLKCILNKYVYVCLSVVLTLVYRAKALL